jgi:hypothetical protein
VNGIKIMVNEFELLLNKIIKVESTRIEELSVVRKKALDMKKQLFVLFMVSMFAPTQTLPGQELDYYVYFSVDGHQIDEKGKNVLDKLVTDVSKYSYYEMKLDAHTDHDGSNSYNMGLSARRAKSVRSYLLSKGLNNKLIHSKWHGETRPASPNVSDDEKSRNRRVRVVFSGFNFKKADDLLDHLDGNQEQVFYLKGDSRQTIKGKNGTEIIIPANAFMTKSGKPVPNGFVQIRLEEFPGMQRAIYNRLSTQSRGANLESAGMLKITATFKGEELVLRNKKEVGIELPSDINKSDMKLFRGNMGSNNVMDWDRTRTGFQIDLAKYNKNPFDLDKRIIQEYILSLGNRNVPEFKIEYKLPIKPLVPTHPKKPKEPTLGTDKTSFSAFARFFIPKSIRVKILAKRNAPLIKAYKARNLKYLKKLDKYRIANADYSRDSAKFVKDSLAFYPLVITKINDLTAIYRQTVDRVDSMKLNANLQKMIGSVNRDKSLLRSPSERFLSYPTMGVDKVDVMTMDAIKYQVYKLKKVLNQEMDKISVVNNKVVINYFNKKKTDYQYTGSLGYQTNWSSVSSKFLESNSGVRQLLARLDKQYNKKVKDAKNLASKDPKPTYTTRVTSLGFFNCDRFSSTPPNLMAKIKMNAPTDARISIYLEDENSLLYPTKDGKYQTANIPKNSVVRVIAFQVKNGIPQYCNMKFKHVSDRNMTLHLKPTTMERIKKEMALL